MIAVIAANAKQMSTEMKSASGMCAFVNKSINCIKLILCALVSTALEIAIVVPIPLISTKFVLTINVFVINTIIKILLSNNVQVFLLQKRVCKYGYY